MKNKYLLVVLVFFALIVSLFSCQPFNKKAKAHIELSPDLKDASRFLSQATLGANFEDIEHLQKIGVENWLEEQFSLIDTSYLEKYKSIYGDITAQILTLHGNMPKPYPQRSRHKDYFQYTFYQKVLKEKDLLRNKIAFSLSQLFVCSFENAMLEYRGFANSSYYDIFYKDGFGNFRDLLRKITLHPAMGTYLSHYNNAKGIPALGTTPDENFAREIMQLFTIGLVELNNDGSIKLDANQQKIPTYNILDVQELAKVFTGLSGGAWNVEFKPKKYKNKNKPLTFGKPHNHYILTVPMKMFENKHEPGPKTMIDGTIIPGGQNGMKDIDMALDILFNHPNVGPFISRRLIQQMVKSNPTPAYINRVATVFNDNGDGVRGDMKAIIRAILLDTEARDSSWINDAKSGKLRQPIERLTYLFRAFDIDSPSGKLWFRDFDILGEELDQSIFASKSVFNFYSPFYAASSILPDNMVSPEFEILNDASSISYLNIIEEAIKEQPFKNITTIKTTDFKNDDSSMSGLELLNTESDKPYLDFTDELEIYQTKGLEALINRLDLIICNGQLSDGTKKIISNTITKLIENEKAYSDRDVINDTLYFIMVSPDYLILK